MFDHLHHRYGNKILVTDELPDGQMVDQWEPVSTDSLKTLLEVGFGMNNLCVLTQIMHPFM